GVFGLASRETALVANNVLLAVGCFVVFIGTMWPMVADMAFGRKLSVGPPFFEAAFTPFMIALGLLLPVGSLMPWKRARFGRALWSLRYAAVLAVALAGLAWTLQTGRSLLGPVGLLLGAWIVAGAALDLWIRAGRTPARLLRLPGADWGRATAHAGLGVTMLAIAGLMAWQQEDIRVAQPGQPFAVGAYTLTLQGVENLEGPNYIATRATVDLARDGRMLAVLHPEKRMYPVARMPTTEAAIDYRLLRDVYVVIGDQQADGGWVVRTYIKPLANWIWGGCLMMALGGLISLSDRRFRVAAGARRARPVPAE
ncbi:MAG: cytochrome c-type biogenesis CcmF C-terminal domain-containing protein, partial [Pseudomonadota bacterium]|nr:cytochrome c-type biogenesis CcmF C-terminal domain-containing protein [Pseudomonadota bacterium]